MITFLIWIIGTVLFYAADGYFTFPFRIPETKFFYEKNLIGVAAPFWPITLWIALAVFLRRVAVKSKQSKDQKIKVRVAEIKEAAELLQIGEEEAEKVLESVARKTL